MLVYLPRLKWCHKSSNLSRQSQTLHLSTLFKELDMIVELTEFKKLLEAGHRYLDGVATLAELNGQARATLEAGHFWGASAPVMEVTQNWEHMINRAWNEMGEHHASLTEAQFSEWLRQQFYFPVRDS